MISWYWIPIVIIGTPSFIALVAWVLYMKAWYDFWTRS